MTSSRESHGMEYGQMAKSKNRTRKSADKSDRKSKSSSRATQARPATQAFSYAGRIPVIRDAVKSLGGSARIAELFEEIGTGKDGEFATPRRIAAAIRHQPDDAPPVLQNVGGVVSLVKRAAKTAKRATVNRKRTRAAK